LALRAKLDEIIASHTNKTAEEVHKDSERDRFFTAQEAAEYGLIDKVIASSDTPA
jgi:ATP-dependent Clp protease protease subunit